MALLALFAAFFPRPASGAGNPMLKPVIATLQTLRVQMATSGARLKTQWQAATLNRLAHLDFTNWDKADSPNAHNVTRLDPLLAAIPGINGRNRVTGEAFEAMGFAERMDILAPAAVLASKRVNGYVDRTLDRLYNDQIPDEALASSYDKLERVWLLEDPYLDGAHRKRLEVELPLFKKVVEDYVWERDIKVARRMEAERRRLESQGTGQGGELMEAQEGEAPVQAYDPEEPSEHPNRNERQGLKNFIQFSPTNYPEKAEEIKALRGRFFAARDQKGMLAADWPLKELQLLYHDMLKRDVAQADPSAFRIDMDLAFGKMEELVQGLFRDFRKVGKLGPWARAAVKALESQSQALYEWVHALKRELAAALVAKGNGHAYNHSPYYNRDKGRLEKLQNLISKLAMSLDTFWARSAAHEATRRLLWYEEKEWDADGSRVPHLIAIVDYYKNRIAQAKRDKHDPSHLEEVLREMRYGEYEFNPLNILTFDEVFGMWRRASRQKGNARALFWKAAARITLAALLNGAWLAGLLYLLQMFQVALPPAFLIAMPVYSGLLLMALLARNRLGIVFAVLMVLGGFSLFGSVLAWPALLAVASAWGAAMIFTYLPSAGKVELLRRFKGLRKDFAALARD